MKGRGIRAHHNYIAVTILRLSRSEFYRMHPGLFYDMVQCYSDSHKPKDDNTVTD